MTTEDIMTQHPEYVITRRFSLDGQVVDYLLDWDDEHGTSCTLSLDRAMRITTGFGEAVRAVAQAKFLVPTWCQSAAERAAGIPARPIVWGIGEVRGASVIPVVDYADPREYAEALA